MNLLKNTRCYLVGPMDRIKDGETWRNYAEAELERFGIGVFNPYRKPINKGLETKNQIELREQYIREGNYDAVEEIMKEVIQIDLRMVDLSDFIVVNLDMSGRPWGTAHEVVMANIQKKPIIVYIEEGKHNAPRWMFGQIPHKYIFDKWGDLWAYLERVDQGKESDERWKIFELIK